MPDSSRSEEDTSIALAGPRIRVCVSWLVGLALGSYFSAQDVGCQPSTRKTLAFYQEDVGFSPGRQGPGRREGAAACQFRPDLCVMEDKLVLVTSGFFGSATHALVLSFTLSRLAFV